MNEIKPVDYSKALNGITDLIKAYKKEKTVDDAIIPPTELPWKDVTDEMIENFAKIRTLDFNYKGDDQEHIGVSAQNLETNPITEGAVVTMDDGTKAVDTRHLTTANTAVLSEVCKALIDITERLKKLEVEQ